MLFPPKLPPLWLKWDHFHGGKCTASDLFTVRGFGVQYTVTEVGDHLLENVTDYLRQVPIGWDVKPTNWECEWLGRTGCGQSSCVHPSEHRAMEPEGLSHILPSGSNEGWQLKFSEPLSIPDTLKLNKGPSMQIRSDKAQRLSWGAENHQNGLWW